MAGGMEYRFRKDRQVMEVKDIYPKDVYYVIEFSRSDIEKLTMACNRIIMKFNFDGNTKEDDACKFFINNFYPMLKELVKMEDSKIES